MASDLTFTIGEVAQSLGVTPHTIRAWERRYGLPPPSRKAGQRSYTAEDIDLLLRVSYAVSVNRRSLRLAVLEAQGLLIEEVMGQHESIARVDLDANEASSGLPWGGIADVIPQMLMLMDQRGIVVDCNVATARILDTVREQMRGVRFTDLVINYDRAKAVRLFRPTLRSATAWELRLRTRRGEQAPMAFDAHIMTAGETELLGLVGWPVQQSTG
jgi:PAS domain S-box-containing protein